MLDGDSQPGPNHWTKDNVWLDAQGALNLRVDDRGSAMVISKDQLRFGKYTWVVEGPLNEMHPGITFCMFQYPSHQAPGTHEIDIEISQWDHPEQTQRLGYTVWPLVTGGPKPNHLSVVSDVSPRVFSYQRSQNTVTFDGHHTVQPASNEPMTVRMSLWAHDGKHVPTTVVRILSFKVE